MADRYVATTGNDGAAGTIGAPWLTGQHALDVASDGDVINVRGGTYTETLATVSDGGVGNVITFQGYPGETAIFQPAYPSGNALTVTHSHYKFKDLIIDAVNSAFVDSGGLVTYNNNTDIVFENVEVKNGLYSGIVIGDTSSFVTLLNCSSHDNCRGDDLFQGHGAYLQGTDIIVDGGEYHHNHGLHDFSYGIHAYRGAGGVNNITIKNIWTHHNDFGIILSSGDNLVAFNILCTDNSHYGVQIDYSATNVKVYSSTIRGNAGAAVICDNGASGIVRNNIFYGNAGDSITVVSGSITQSNNVTSDPLFIDAPGDNFHLSVITSPAVGAGLDLGSSYNVDKDGISRPQGANGLWDCGCFEFFTPVAGQLLLTIQDNMNAQIIQIVNF